MEHQHSAEMTAVVGGLFPRVSAVRCVQKLQQYTAVVFKHRHHRSAGRPPLQHVHDHVCHSPLAPSGMDNTPNERSTPTVGHVECAETTGGKFAEKLSKKIVPDVWRYMLEHNKRVHEIETP